MLNYNNISLIDSKSFFSSIETRYSLPLMQLKKIKTYSLDNNVPTKELAKKLEDIIDLNLLNQVLEFEFTSGDNPELL